MPLSSARRTCNKFLRTESGTSGKFERDLHNQSSIIKRSNARFSLCLGERYNLTGVSRIVPRRSRYESTKGCSKTLLDRSADFTTADTYRDPQ